MAQLNRDLEGEKVELARDVTKAKSDLQALWRSENTAVAQAEVAAVKILELEAKVDAAKRRESATITAHAGVVQEVVEKQLRSDKFSSLANELASILTILVKNKTLDAVSKKYPDSDKAQFGYKEMDRDVLLRSYAKIILKYADAFLVVESLSTLTSPLIAEAVLACIVDEDHVLAGVIASLGNEKRPSLNPSRTRRRLLPKCTARLRR